MNEFNPLPESITHKQLNSLLTAAQKTQRVVSEPENDLHNEQKEFQKLLSTWSSLSNEILTQLKKRHEYIVGEKSSKALMALGAFQAHLNLAVQAQEASESEWGVKKKILYKYKFIYHV